MNSKSPYITRAAFSLLFQTPVKTRVKVDVRYGSSRSRVIFTPLVGQTQTIYFEFGFLITMYTRICSTCAPARSLCACVTQCTHTGRCPLQLHWFTLTVWGYFDCCFTASRRRLTFYPLAYNAAPLLPPGIAAFMEQVGDCSSDRF